MKKIVKSIIISFMILCLGVNFCFGAFADDSVSENNNNKVVLIGDSICQAYQFNYRFLGGLIPDNFGIMGRNTTDVLNNISEAYGDYDKMFIICGTNDRELEGFAEHTFTKSMSNYKNILENVHEHMPKTHIYVTGILPSNWRHIGRIKDSIPYNEKLKALCSQYGYVTYIDECWEKLYDPETEALIAAYSDKTDGLHLNEAGYKALSDILIPYFYETLLSGNVLYQLNNKNSSQLRFVAEMNIKDVQEAESGSYSVKMNDNDAVNVAITKAYKAIMCNGTKITAPEGKCYVITSVIKNCSAGDRLTADFNLSDFGRGISRVIAIE